MTQPTQDVRVTFVRVEVGTFRPFASYPAGWSPVFALTAYPADDDPRFPYHPRQGHAAGFQFDLTCARTISEDYVNGLLDELGAPILDEYGAQIT